jgi:predicted methyltransferase
MKEEDMVGQAGFIARKFCNLKTVFVGDGDSVALSMLHLWKRGLLAERPKHIRVLDFDERIVNAINRFAETHGYRGLILAELYNVAEPLPKRLIGRADAFYTNPPWGANNDGNSVVAFVLRGIEAVTNPGLGAIVIADDPTQPWTQKVLYRAQGMLLEHGFIIKELGEERHHYHLDDDPDLQSCTIITSRLLPTATKITSRMLERGSFANFYGRNRHLLQGTFSIMVSERDPAVRTSPTIRFLTREEQHLCETFLWVPD